MRRGVAVAGAVLGFLAATSISLADAAAVRTGSICVSAVPLPTPGEQSLGNPTGGGRTWAYSVQIDDGIAQATSHQHAIRIERLALGRRHVIRIWNKGELATSFWFTFEKLGGATDGCLWFKPLYETWSLWPMRDARHLCSCS
jgi:hypothetical protein